MNFEEFANKYYSDSGWIRADERLPKKDGKYLIYYAGDVMMGSFYVGGGWYFNGVRHKQLAFWMPLPEPPEDR